MKNSATSNERGAAAEAKYLVRDSPRVALTYNTPTPREPPSLYDWLTFLKTSLSAIVQPQGTDPLKKKTDMNSV